MHVWNFLSFTAIGRFHNGTFRCESTIQFSLFWISISNHNIIGWNMNLNIFFLHIADMSNSKRISLLKVQREIFSLFIVCSLCCCFWFCFKFWVVKMFSLWFKMSSNFNLKSCMQKVTTKFVYNFTQSTISKKIPCLENPTSFLNLINSQNY